MKGLRRAWPSLACLWVAAGCATSHSTAPAPATPVQARPVEVAQPGPPASAPAPARTVPVTRGGDEAAPVEQAAIAAERDRPTRQDVIDAMGPPAQPISDCLASHGQDLTLVEYLIRGQSGRVHSVRLMNSEDPALLACVAAALSPVEFQPFTLENFMVRFPFKRFGS